MEFPREIPVGAVRRDERRDGDGGAVGEQFGDFGDAADVFFAVFGREAEVLVEAEADVVAVEAVGGEVERLAEKSLFEGDGDGGFTRGGEAGQPDGEALLAAEGLADARGDGGGVVGYVAGGWSVLVVVIECGRDARS